MKTVRIGDLQSRGVAELTTGPFGTQLSADQYTHDGTPVINVRNVGYGEIRTHGLEFLPAEHVERLARHRLQEGDIVFGRKGAVDRHALITSRETGWIQGSDCIRLRLDKNVIDPTFVSFTLRTEWHRRWMHNYCSFGATMASLNQEILSLVEIPLPALEDQRRMARELGMYDGLIDNNRRRIEILEEMARLLYREWFVHLRFPGHEDSELIDSDIGPIPDGWKAGKFSDLVSEIKQTVSPDNISEGTPVVGLQHLPRRSTTLYEWEEASQVGSRRKIFSEGDILFGKIRPYFHKVVDAPISGCSSTDTIVFRPKEESFRCRALAVASSDEFVGVATATSNGTKMPRANTGVLMNYCIPHPTHDVEQAFSDIVGPIDSLRKTLAAQNRVLRGARNLLLPRLVSGELDVSELDIDLVVEAV